MGTGLTYFCYIILAELLENMLQVLSYDFGRSAFDVVTLYHVNQLTVFEKCNTW